MRESVTVSLAPLARRIARITKIGVIEFVHPLVRPPNACVSGAPRGARRASLARGVTRECDRYTRLLCDGAVTYPLGTSRLKGIEARIPFGSDSCTTDGNPFTSMISGAGFFCKYQ